MQFLFDLLKTGASVFNNKAGLAVIFFVGGEL